MGGAGMLRCRMNDRVGDPHARGPVNAEAAVEADGARVVDADAQVQTRDPARRASSSKSSPMSRPPIPCPCMPLEEIDVQVRGEVATTMLAMRPSACGRAPRSPDRRETGRRSRGDSRRAGPAATPLPPRLERTRVEGAEEIARDALVHRRRRRARARARRDTARHRRGRAVRATAGTGPSTVPSRRRCGRRRGGRPVERRVRACPDDSRAAAGCIAGPQLPRSGLVHAAHVTGSLV